jgi:hypothetical protein
MHCYVDDVATNFRTEKSGHNFRIFSWWPVKADLQVFLYLQTGSSVDFDTTSFVLLLFWRTTGSALISFAA